MSVDEPNSGEAERVASEQDATSLVVVLRLYVAGLTPRSTAAVARVRALCEQYLCGRYELAVVDLYLQPDEAKRAQIVVAPTLVKLSPTPYQFFIGDMQDNTAFLQSLNNTA